MRYHRFAMLLVVVLACGFESSAFAQSTVQLPSFSRFTYSGSVLVPTGGATSLGGVSRSSSGRSSRRFGGHAFGGGLGHAGASVHTTIIDNDAIDRQIRGLGPKGTAKTITGPVSGPANGTVNHTVKMRKRNPAPAVDPDAEGKVLVRFARKQYTAGNRTSAFDVYQLAIETLSPKLSELAAAEFRRVFPTGIRPVDIQPSRLAAGKGVNRND